MNVRLNEYLASAYQIEVAKYELETTLDVIHARLRQKPQLQSLIEEEKRQSGMGVIVFFLIVDIVIFILGLNVANSLNGIIAIFGYPMMGFAIIGFVSTISLAGSEMSLSEEGERKYNEAVRYNQEARVHNSRVLEEHQRNQVALTAQKRMLDSRYEKLCNLRKRFYASGVVAMDYQNLVAISSLYKYIRTGMCDRLEGAHGAYEHFEYLSRMNMIVRRLDEAIVKLDEIRNRQEELYYAIQEGKRNSAALVNELSSTKNQLIRANQTLDNIETYERNSNELLRIDRLNNLLSGRVYI